MDYLTELGVGAIVAILIIDRVFAFLKNKKDDSAPAWVQKFEQCHAQFETRMGRLETKLDYIREQLADMQPRMVKLDESHAVLGTNGLPMWYTRQTMEDAVKALTEEIKVFRDAIKNQITQIKHMEELIERVHKIE